MDQITHAFGINAHLLIIQIVNFGILLLVLWKFLYTPLLKLIDERRAKIEKGVHDAEAASRAREGAEKDRTELLRAASKDAEALSERSRKDAALKAGEIITEAEERALRAIASAEREGNELKARALSDAKSEIAKLIVLGAEKALSEKK